MKDNNIASINLLSNGYIVVCDKDGKPIKKHCGAWRRNKELDLRQATPEGVEFGSWGILNFARQNMRFEELRKKKDER